MRASRKELENIFEYIAKDSPQNAQAMIDRLVDAIDDLAFMPARFRVAGKSRVTGEVVRARTVPPFIVYYQILPTHNMVHILQVRHGARKQPRSF